MSDGFAKFSNLPKHLTTIRLWSGSRAAAIFSAARSIILWMPKCMSRLVQDWCCSQRQPHSKSSVKLLADSNAFDADSRQDLTLQTLEPPRASLMPNEPTHETHLDAPSSTRRALRRSPHDLHRVAISGGGAPRFEWYLGRWRGDQDCVYLFLA